MAHLQLVQKKKVSSFRKLAIGTWATAYDPTVYGSISVRMEKALEYMDQFRRRTGLRLTVTHMVTKVCAEALRRCPDANAIIRFNKIYLRQNVNLSVLVVQPGEGEGKVDLTAAKIEDADQKSLYDIVVELGKTISRARNREDAAIEKGKGTIRAIPFMLMNFFLKMISFLSYTLNLNLTALGIPRDAFGSLTVTNIGSLGLDVAYVPLVPYTNVPIFIAPGAIKDTPVVENGRVVPGKVMSIHATFDHRFIDGYHASVLSKTVQEMFSKPHESFGDIESLPKGEGKTEMWHPTK